MAEKKVKGGGKGLPHCTPGCDWLRQVPQKKLYKTHTHTPHPHPHHTPRLPRYHCLLRSHARACLLLRAACRLPPAQRPPPLQHARHWRRRLPTLTTTCLACHAIWRLPCLLPPATSSYAACFAGVARLFGTTAGFVTKRLLPYATF